MSVPFWIVFITTIIYSFKEIFSLPANLPHFTTIRILAYASPLFGIMAGLIAYEQNNKQTPYLVWYPIFVTIILVIIIGGLTYLIKRKYTLRLLKSGTNLPPKESKWFEIIVVLTILTALLGGIYPIIDSLLKDKRDESYKKCLTERYGGDDYSADSRDASERPDDRCIKLTHKSWGF